ncbi:MAG: hypothetical protein Q9M19_00310, partial [Mariprofundaceae bacterium]|nr:hypothetical protein [Mariprofundaceae bacterium]
ACNMSWDRSSRAKRLTRKQRKFLITISFFVAFLFVLIWGVVGDLKVEGGISMLVDMADSLLSDEEKRTVWDSMSEEGRDVIRRHTPAGQ